MHIRFCQQCERCSVCKRAKCQSFWCQAEPEREGSDPLRCEYVCLAPCQRLQPRRSPLVGAAQPAWDLSCDWVVAPSHQVQADQPGPDRLSDVPRSQVQLCAPTCLPQQCENMTNATKRLREVEDDGDDGTSSWNVFYYGDNYPHSGYQPAPSYVGNPGYEAPMPKMQNQTMPQLPVINGKIPLPKGLNEIAWGKSFCTMDKVKEWSPHGRSCVGLIEDAKKSAEICAYLKWIKKAFRTGGSGIVKKKITPAVDLALYLERMGWMDEEADAPFVREFADWQSPWCHTMGEPVSAIRYCKVPIQGV